MGSQHLEGGLSESGAALVEVCYEVQGAVAHIELNRPARLNAWTPAMGLRLLDALEQAADDASVRAILLTGAGRAFCAGADVKERPVGATGVPPDLSVDLRTVYNPVMLALRQLPKPVVAAVQGPCAGLGVSLALACDFVLAADDAFLLFAFAQIGVVPDAGATIFLTERVGLARATQLCMLGERLTAATARDWGLIYAVHPSADLRSAAWALTDRLAAGPTIALGNTKRALSLAAQRHLAEQLDLEASLQQQHGSTHDYAEGVAAHLEKRAPKFLGR